MATGTLALDKAEELELLAAALYRDLAARPGLAPEQRAMFERLEREESEHASRVRLLKSLYIRSPRVGSGALDLPHIDALLEEARRLPTELGALSMPELLSRLIALEERFAIAHSEGLAKGSAAETLFTTLAQQDREHAKLLANARKDRP